MPRPTAIETAKRFRTQLATQEAQAAERMATVYARIYTGLLNDSRSLADQLAGMDEINRAKVMKLARVQSLLKQVEAEVTRFGGTVQGEVTIIQSQAIQQGIDDALKLMQASLPDLPPEVARALTASFTRLHRDAIESAAGLMGADSPLRQQLETKFGEYVAGQVETHFLDGIGQGMRADRITALLQRNLQNGLGSGLTSVLRTLRTAQVTAYRTSNHATYLANSNIVSGWYWWAFLGDGRVCLSCVEQHGSLHPVDETLEDHWNGRCAPIPATVSYQDLGLDIPEEPFEPERGEDWFNRQPEAVQKDFMGRSMWEAWKDGAFDFRDLSQKTDDPIFGTMYQEASLKGLLGDKAEKYYKK